MRAPHQLPEPPLREGGEAIAHARGLTLYWAAERYRKGPDGGVDPGSTGRVSFVAASAPPLL